MSETKDQTPKDQSPQDQLPKDLPQHDQPPQHDLSFWQEDATEEQTAGYSRDLPHPLGPDRRVRTLTEKGLGLYKSNRNERFTKLCKAWDFVVCTISLIYPCSKSMKFLRETDSDLRNRFSKYRELETEFFYFSEEY